MFKFLKDKLSKAVSLFSKKVEEEAQGKQELPDSEPNEQIQPTSENKEEKRSALHEDLVIPQSSKEPSGLAEQKEPSEDEKKADEGKRIEEKTISQGMASVEEKIPRSDTQQTAQQPGAILEQQKANDEEKNLAVEEVMEELGAEPIVLPDFEQEEAAIKEPLEDETQKENQKLVEGITPEDLHEIEEVITELETAPQKKEKKSLFKRLFGKKENEEKDQGLGLIQKQEVEGPEVFEIKPKAGQKADPGQTILVPPEAVKEPKHVVSKLILAEEKKAEARIERKEERETSRSYVSQEYDKKGFFARIKENITTIKLTDEKFEKLFWDLELAMLENNVAVEVIEKIKDDLRRELTAGKVSRKGIDELIADSLRQSVESLFIVEKINLIDKIREKQQKPFIIAFVGVNGSGKTTTMAKMARLLLKNGLSVVFAASDTFRAAAIQQLQEHADNLGIKMIRHDYESDPAAVAFDAIKHAQAKAIDVVMIDTAGRLHTNDNLMNELKKLVRVNSPDMKIFIGESITGNDCVEQAKLFNEAVGIDAIVLAKADVDEKGGAAISVSYVTKRPIIYLGTGQGYDDLVEFDPEIIVKGMGL